MVLPSLDPRNQAELLRSVCAWRLDELTDELTDGAAAADLRAVPFGTDSEGASFYWFGTEDCYVFRRARCAPVPGPHVQRPG